MPGQPPPATAIIRRRDLSRASAVRPIASALKLDDGHVSLIDQSHSRCAALGLSRIDRPDHSPVGRSDLSLIRERNLRLYRHAAPVMDMLREQIATTASMVVLTDASGTVLHSTGDADFLVRASQVALRPGANWSEPSQGTNAIGTALMEERPTLVHADEHYMHANHFLTCSAAPILDPRGNILGVLDVTGDHRSYHQHTMALVKLCARMIENHWLSDDSRDVMRLHFHHRSEFIGTLMEGILAVRPDGRIAGANRAALEQLGLSAAALRTHSVDSLFGTSVATLVDRFRSPLATPWHTGAAGPQAFYLHARFDWPVWARSTDAVPRTPRTPQIPRHPGAARVPPAVTSHAAPSRGNALAQLDTGDAAMSALISRLRRTIDRDIPILLLGETGTGKSRLARALHDNSRRAGAPFIAIDCAALGEGDAGTIAEIAHIEQAQNGTLFLDEIGDMPPALQGPLLRVLEERQILKTLPGGERRAVALDIAIVSATHHNLRERIDAGTFREDLYHRLNGLALQLPALRERSDLHTLAQRILDAEAPAGAPSRKLAGEVHAMFEASRWRGNLRQLRNVLRSAASMAPPGALIEAVHLPDDFREEAQAAAAATMGHHDGDTKPALSLGALQLQTIRRVVGECAGNISEAARRLGVSRNTVYRQLQRGAER